MSQDISDYEQKIAKANAACQRQLDKQKVKQASPEYQKAQQEKQQASQLKSQQRAFEKKKAQLDDPAYQKEQQEKQYQTQIKSFEKQRARQQVKEASPEYKVQKTKLIKSKPIKSSPIKSSPIKSRGIKGRNPTAIEKILANKIGDIGCICCLNKKWYTSDMAEQESTKFVSLHHVEGRTKEWAHAKVLPLCAYHHDIPAPSHAPEELTPIHRGNKKEWIELNGTEEELLKQVYDIIEEDRPWLG